jgi:hypothetical protein
MWSAAARQILWGSLKDILLSNLGHCTKCMRTSFVAAVAAWTLFIAAYATAPSAIATLADLAAISLSALWLAHIIVFAGKATISTAASARDDKRASRIPTLSRRELVPIFLRTLAFGAVITTAPRAITSAFGQAQGPCDGCSRYKGSTTCWTCCGCQNSNCITGCKNTTDPDKYNTCIASCSATFRNCNNGCQ